MKNNKFLQSFPNKSSYLPFMTLIALIMVIACFCGRQKSPSENKIDGEGQTSYTLLPNESEIQNHLAFGNRTIAVVKDKYAKYTFGVGEEGEVGVVEVISNDRIGDYYSVTDDTTVNLIDFIQKLVPNVPQEVLENLRKANVPPRPYNIETDLRVPPSPTASFPSSSTNFCSTFPSWEDPWEEYTFYTFNHFVQWQFMCNGTPPFSYFGIGCAEETMFRSSHVNSKAFWSQRTASAYSPTDDGTCAAYGKVKSCSDSWTLFRLDFRPSSAGGEFSNVFSEWVPPGALTTCIWYANPDRSCKNGKDKDDYRFRSDSSPGGGHLYFYGFVHEASDSGTCEACD